MSGIGGVTKQCARHGQYIDTGRGCVVCDGEPKSTRNIPPNKRAYRGRIEAGYDPNDEEWHGDT